MGSKNKMENIIYAFYLYEDNKTILPSEIHKVDPIEEVVDVLEEENILVVASQEDREVWIFSYDYNILDGFIKGMDFSINQMMVKTWDQIITPSHPELMLTKK
jgi:hypothetical protein